MNTRESIAKQCAEWKALKLSKAQIKDQVAVEAFERFVSLGDVLVKLDIIEEILWQGYEKIRTLDETGLPMLAEVPLTKERISMLGKVQDKNLRLLNKFVGDKKAIEMSGEGPLFGRQSREELEANLKRYNIDPDVVRASAALL